MNDIVIHVHSAPAEAFFVNSFIIETADSQILVDTQFLVSSAAALKARMDGVGKPLAAVIVTHPHPDHYNGLPIVLAGRADIPVYATRQTIDGIAATQAAKRAAWTPVYGADYPTEDALPNIVATAGQALKVAGVALVTEDLGPGECSDITVIHVPQADALIASDLIYTDCHPWLAEGRTRLWLRQLDQIEKRFGNVGSVYPGHGPAGGPEQIGQQRNYIERFRAAVDGFRQGAMLSDDALSEIRSRTLAGRESWPLAMLIDMNAKAVASELAANTSL